MKKITLVISFSCIAFCVKSQWNSNPSVNNIVSNKTGTEYNLEVSVPDGANGSIVFLGNYDGGIYAQRINNNGNVVWGSSTNPLTICNTVGYQTDVFAISDGAGGAFVSWTDYGHDEYLGEIYLQKISPAGAVQWTANGVRVTNISRDDFSPLICPDGLGGVILSWYGDDTLAKNIQSYAQRYNSAGVAQWTANGIQVCTAPGFRASSSIVPDGANGAFIFFLDTRNDPHGLDYDYLNDNELTNSDIYGQRLNASGTRLWGNNGLPIITAPGNQNDDINRDAIPDGSGNTILVFDDGRNDDGEYTNYDIYAQKVNSNGIPQWTANGIAVCTAAGNQFVNGVATDGAGGVIVSMDYEADFNRLYAQRVTASGAVSWTAGGVAVSPAGVEVYDGTLAADGNGNSIFSYDVAGSSLLKAQKLNAAGVLQWGAAGTTVCNMPQAYPNQPSITLSDAGSVIIAWSDGRNMATPSELDVYASKILATGVLAGSASTGYTTIANGNWSNPAIWSGGAVPPAGAVVVIRHNVTGNINTSCATVTVETPGVLTVNPGIVINITN